MRLIRIGMKQLTRAFIDLRRYNHVRRIRLSRHQVGRSKRTGGAIALPEALSSTTIINTVFVPGLSIIINETNKLASALVAAAHWLIGKHGHS
jgi:hypothetical protein